jgi:sugar-specific transcriptional regulator TrmB
MSKIIDDSVDKDLLVKLQELGLGHKEAAVYMALLPRQDTGTSVLIKLTGLHGQFVYDALGKLEELGLAKHVIQNGRKKFSANPPQRLLTLIEEKRLSAQSVAKELQERFAGKHEQSFEVFQGESAFIAHQFDLLERQPDNTQLCAIASESERYQLILQTFGVQDRFLARMKEKNLKVRYLGSAYKPSRTQEVLQTGLWEYRSLPGNATGLMNTDIWHDNVTINVFGDQVLSLTITSTEVAQGYREFFNAVWALASK